MGMELLKELYLKKHFLLKEHFDCWEEAVKASVQPLIDTGAVKVEYADRVVEMVKKYGPYICICPHVAIPHAMAPELVCSETPVLCFMKVNDPVKFSDRETECSELFFSLASPSGQAHLEELQILVELLDQEEIVNSLLAAKTEEDFKRLFDL